MLQPRGITVAQPDDLGISLHVEETGNTFAENARLKAEAFSQTSGLIALADDSGLVVDALGGEPGVHSARYGGLAATDLDRVHLVLERMRNVPDAERTARFVAVVAVAAPGREAATFEGQVEGCIAREPRGTAGFGYDPIFYYPPWGCTFAEVTRDRKAEVSHRGKAMSAAVAYLLSEQEGLYT